MNTTLREPKLLITTKWLKDFVDKLYWEIAEEARTEVATGVRTVRRGSATDWTQMGKELKRIAEEKKDNAVSDYAYPSRGSRRNSTDWAQMGRDLRHIADDYRASNESLDSSPASPPVCSSYLCCNRRRSLPDTTAIIHHQV